jgi:hypothetical protein
MQSVERTVVAYSVRYDIAGAIHGAGKIFVQHEYPTAVLTKAPVWSAHNEPLRPGDRLVTALGAVFARCQDLNDP